MVWGRGSDHLDSINALREATRTVQDAFADGLDTTFPTASTPPPPLLSAPGDRALGQPVTPTLHWHDDGHAGAYHVELATDVAFSSIVAQHTVSGRSSLTLDTLALNQTYYWRIRAENGGGYSPFSAVRAFSTSDAVIRAPDVLFLSDGSRAYVEVAGPGGLDPCGPEALSTFGCTEVGLLVSASDFDMPSFDTTELHARAALDIALGA